MKRLLIALSIVLLLASCSKEDQKNIVGEWETDNEGGGYPKFSFASDDNFSWSISESKTFKGTYRISGGNVFLKHGGEEFKFNFSVDGNILTMDRNDAVYGELFRGSYNLIRE